VAHQSKADNRAPDPSVDEIQLEVRARLVRILAGCIAVAAVVVFVVAWFRPPVELRSAGESASHAIEAPAEPTPASPPAPRRLSTVVLPTLAVFATAEQLQREYPRQDPNL
jgi:hypothetical protein